MTKKMQTDQAMTLAKDSVGLRQVLAQSFISNGPLASVTVALTGAAAFGLGSLPLVFVLGAVVILLWINTPFQFSRHIQTSGGLYSMTRAGVGRNAAFATTSAYVCGYMAIIAANAMFAAAVVEAILATFGVGLNSWWWVPISLALLLVPYALTITRVSPALNYGLATAAIELTLLLVLSITLIVHAGHANTAHVFTASFGLGGWHGIIIGAFVASNSLAGCESAIGLGEEAKTPRRTIQRAMLISQLSLVAFYVLVSYALTIGWGPAHMGTFAESGAPGLTLVQTVWGQAGVVIVGLLIINSLVGVNMGCSMFAGRMLLDMARDRQLSRHLTRINPRHQTPHVSLTVVTLGEIAIAMFCGLVWGPIVGALVAIVGSTAGLFIGQFGADVALALYGLRRHYSAGLYIVIPLLAMAATVAGVWANFIPVVFPYVWGPIAVAAILILAAVWVLARHNHDRTLLDVTAPYPIASDRPAATTSAGESAAVGP